MEEMIGNYLNIIADSVKPIEIGLKEAVAGLAFLYGVFKAGELSSRFVDCLNERKKSLSKLEKTLKE